MLKFPPIKSRPLPKGIIYGLREKNHYMLTDLSSGKLVGEMSLIKRPCDNLPFYDTQPNATTLHIYSLYAYEQNKGWGSYLIDFAKRESYRQGCEGRCSLVAHHSGIAPHTFYKKQGFITQNIAYNNYLDECNKQGHRLYFEPPKNMFIPFAKHSKADVQIKSNPTPRALQCKENLITEIKQAFIFFTHITKRSIKTLFE